MNFSIARWSECELMSRFSRNSRAHFVEHAWEQFVLRVAFSFVFTASFYENIPTRNLKNAILDFFRLFKISFFLNLNFQINLYYWLVPTRTYESILLYEYEEPYQLVKFPFDWIKIAIPLFIIITIQLSKQSNFISV